MQGSSAQAGEEIALQPKRIQENKHQRRTPPTANEVVSYATDTAAFGQLKGAPEDFSSIAFQKKSARPQRPVPSAMFFLGFLMILLWGLTLLGMLLTTGAVALLFFVLVLVLSPLLVLGLIFIIGGMLVSIGGGRRR